MIDGDAPASPLALGLCLAGVGALFTAWQQGRHGPRHALWVWAGWLALLCAAWVWTDAAGLDRGVTFAILAAGLVALAVIAATTSWTGGRVRDGRERDRGSNDIEPGPLSGSVRHALAVFVVAGPLSAVAAMSLSLSMLAVAASTVGANRVVAVFLLMPLLWTGAMLWSCIDSNLRRTAAWLACVTAATVAVVAVAR